MADQAVKPNRAAPAAPDEAEGGDVPQLTAAVERSIAIWSRDLRALFDHAKERFGDICWREEAGSPLRRDTADAIWGHKAVVYVRAPKSFKDRYFAGSVSRPASASSTGGFLPGRATSRASSRRGSDSTEDYARYGRQHLVGDDPNTARNGPVGQVMELQYGGTPELFQSYLEWLYTSEGLGDVVEWIDEDEVDSAQATFAGEMHFGLGFLGAGFPDAMKDSKGRIGSRAERREKLGQDLCYMWRSKLYADVRIELSLQPSGQHPPSAFRNGNLGPGLRRQVSASSINAPQDPSVGPIEDEYEYGAADDAGQTQTAIFSAHRFIMCSRSPYFAQVLLNAGSFQPHSASTAYSAAMDSVEVDLPKVTLSTPPFTPAALHFVLGYLYAGNLGFSNRSFDLSTAFAIYRSANFLEVQSLEQEIQARIVWDFCHGIAWNAQPVPDKAAAWQTLSRSCRCKRCLKRIPRVWRFATAPDVQLAALTQRARRYMIDGWGLCWGREVATADDEHIRDLVDGVKSDISTNNAHLVSHWRHLAGGRRRLAQDTIASGPGRAYERFGATQTWNDHLTSLYDELEADILQITLTNFHELLDSEAFQNLLQAVGFESDLLDLILTALAASAGHVSTCGQAGRLYERIVSDVLLRTSPDSDELILPMHSDRRGAVEAAKETVLVHIKKRWVQIRSEGGFQDMKTWALKEVSDEIEIPMSELFLSPPLKTSISSGATPKTPPPAQRVARESPRSMRNHSRNPSVAPTQDRQVPFPAGAAPTRPAVARPAALASARSPPERSHAATPRTAGLPSVPRSTTAPSIISRPSPQPSVRSALRPTACPSDAVIAAQAAARRRVASVASNLSVATSAAAASLRSGPSVRPAAGSELRVPAARARTRSDQSAQTPANTPGTAGTQAPSPGPRVRSLSVTSTKTVKKAAAAAPAASPAPVEASTARLMRKQPSASSLASQKTASGSNRPPTTKAPPMPAVSTVAAAKKCLLASANIADRGDSAGGPGRSTATRSPAVSMAAMRSMASTTSLATAATARKPAGPSIVSRNPRAPAATTGSKTPISVPEKPAAPTAQPAPGSASRRTLQAGAGRQTQLNGPDDLGEPVNAAHVKAPSIIRRADSARSLRDSGAAPPATAKAAPAATPNATTSPAVIQEEFTGRDPALTPVKRQVPSTPPSIATPRPRISISQVANTTKRPHPASAFDPSPAPKPQTPRAEASDGTIPIAAAFGAPLSVGIPCVVSLTSRRAKFKALCKYLGKVDHPDKPGSWIGIEITDQVAVKYGLSEQTFDGTIAGVRYFCLGEATERTEDITQVDARMARKQRISEIEQRLARRPGQIHSPQPRSAWSASGKKMSSSSRAPTPSQTPDLGSSWILGRVEDDGSGGGAEARTTGLWVRPNEVVFVVGSTE